MTLHRRPDSDTSLADQVATLTARDEIYRILCAYCEAIDNADLAAASELFRHGRWAFVDSPGPEPVRRWLEDNLMLHDGSPKTSHQLSNTVIDVDIASGTASVRTIATALQKVDGTPLQTIFSGRFACTFEHIDGDWWWITHEVSPDLIGDVSRHRNSAGLDLTNLIS
ncbi:nuclear transport factor 2 family protein [Gordonia terrae]